MSHPWKKYQIKTAQDFLGVRFRLDDTREPKFHSNRVDVPIIVLKPDKKLEKTSVDISDIAFSILMRQISEVPEVQQIFTFERDKRDRAIIMEVKA